MTAPLLPGVSRNTLRVNSAIAASRAREFVRAGACPAAIAYGWNPYGPLLTEGGKPYGRNPYAGSLTEGLCLCVEKDRRTRVRRPRRDKWSRGESNPGPAMLP